MTPFNKDPLFTLFPSKTHFNLPLPRARKFSSLALENFPITSNLLLPHLLPHFISSLSQTPQNPRASPIVSPRRPVSFFLSLVVLCLLLKANPETGKEVDDVEGGDGAGLASEAIRDTSTDQGSGFPIFSQNARGLGAGKYDELNHEELVVAQPYALNNCEEVYIPLYRATQGRAQVTKQPKH
ncbi:uncharacterized protein LOC131303747 isoform X2 [Rhododendron vialii]|uniref:uncharacterized protein LOC131303747 isoform X2 n=1 Tax=Rhododendron vialii TaxID=182163 RepID=UPI00265FCC28|nr:uncharacterized protein LOC131303747 isoform X2 [Rhododendron vialii]